MEVLLRDLPYFEESGGGITFSGGEPMMQPQGLLELLQASKEKGVHTTVDTSGFAPPEDFRRILPHTDLFLYDLKNFDTGLHRKYTGVDNTLIRSNADFLLDQGASLVFRIPVVPGINDTEKELEGLIRYITERKENLTSLHLLPYHRIADHKYLRMRMKQNLPHVREPGEEYMEQLRSRFEQTGLEVVIGG
jgi:pyruvate formate lyase activating enzyme